MIDVSVIIPVYNAEKYLKRCVESFKETKANIEVLLIDDKSKDNSKKVAKELEKKYDFVKLIALEENKGVSNARNVGIEKSIGKYVLFSDSDDWYEKGAIDILFNLAQNKKSDFVMANYYISYDNGKKIKVDTTSYFSKAKITKEEVISYMTLTSCSKLIKRSLFVDNNIMYPTNLKRCEELEVIPVIAYLSKNPIVTDEVLYNYYQRSDSASNVIDKDLTYFDKSFANFEHFINVKKYAEEIEFRAIEHLLYGKTLVMIKSKYKREEIISHINDFKEKYPHLTKNKYFKKFNKAKKVFIYSLNYKIIWLAKLFAFIHDKLVG